MNICLIAAIAKNNIIGINNALPWNLPDDMKYFVETTKGFPVIMGRKNWESIPKKYQPLKERPNIILSRNNYYTAPGAAVFNNIFNAFDFVNNFSDKMFVIGGGDIYAQALPYAKILYLTEIDADVKGDCVFPSFDKSNFKELSRIHHNADTRHKYNFDFVIYHNYNPIHEIKTA